MKYLKTLGNRVLPNASRIIIVLFEVPRYLLLDFIIFHSIEIIKILSYYEFKYNSY